ncbi:MAG TPA: LytR C-terminal domain-containing protein [Capillimicrobium sp.]|nr:LytR C-terminal domain-containing protein [Capillimicrobium sp.]
MADAALPAALSVPSQVETIGAIAGLAAILGLAVLSMLYFAQARELKRLREWAGRAPERAAELQGRAVVAAQQRRVQAQPVRQAAQPATPAGQAAQARPSVPGAPGSAPAATPGTPGAPGTAPTPGTPGAPGAPRPATAAPATAAGAAATAAGGAPGTTAPANGQTGTPGAPATPGAPGADQGAGDAAAPAAPAAPAGDDQPTTAQPAPAAPAGVPQPLTPPAARPAPAAPAARSRGAQPLRASTPAATIPPRGGGRGGAPAGGGGRGRGRAIALVTGAVVLVLAAGVFAFTQLGGDDEPSGGRAATTEGNAFGEPARTTREGTREERVPRGETTVAVLNGTTVPGLARAVADRIEAAGYRIGNVTNAPDQQRSATQVSYQEGNERVARQVARTINAGSDAVVPIDEVIQATAGADALVVVTVGADQSQQ